ncbi:MAG: hypothetical protein D6748_15060 [Calditrichaeota bacterium]|nr:MAG: hypothetical protein D6748_15060 [Calditrichota bacterium]
MKYRLTNFLFILIFSAFIGTNTLFGQTSKLNIHGYLTQAYAFSDGHQLFGISHEGTSDYRTLAIQFRYDMDEQNNLIIQFSHERTGKSPLMVYQPDVALDWGYFEHRFTDVFFIKVGKIQLPYGIYNEIRDVGVLIPFYRLPFSPYGEGNYMSETVDGFSLTYFWEKWEPSEIEINFYAGHWQWKEWFQFKNPFTGQTLLRTGIAEIQPATGLQFRLNTPLEGLRLSFGAQYGKVSGGVTFTKGGWVGECDIHDFYGSLDFEQNHFYFRAEGLQLWFHGTNIGARAYYFQSGLKWNDKLSLNGQIDLLDALNTPVSEEFQSLVGAPSVSLDYNNDYAIGINYRLTPELVLKAETHWNSGYLIEDEPVIPIIQDPVKTRYHIFSISTSF